MLEIYAIFCCIPYYRHIVCDKSTGQEDDGQAAQGHMRVDRSINGAGPR